MSLRTDRRTERERHREERERDGKLPRDLEDVEANKKDTCSERRGERERRRVVQSFFCQLVAVGLLPLPCRAVI